MLIAGAIVVPVGLVLAGLIGDTWVLAGAAVGFGVAAVNAAAATWLLIRALDKPPQALPTILMVSYFVRVAALAGILYGLHFVKALDMLALLVAFLALYLAETSVEIYYVWKSFGAALKQPGKAA
jgi:hypothetical protein